LNILNLLPELLDFDAQFEGDHGEARIVRFGAKRVGLAGKLLSQEVELTASSAALADNLAGGVAVGGEPVKLFSDLRFGRKQKRPRRQRAGVEFAIAGKQGKGLREPLSYRLGPAGWRKVGLLS